MKRLLIVWHSRTGAARQISEALERGARRIAAELDQNQNVHIERKAADNRNAPRRFDERRLPILRPRESGES